MYKNNPEFDRENNKTIKQLVEFIMIAPGGNVPGLKYLFMT